MAGIGRDDATQFSRADGSKHAIVRYSKVAKDLPALLPTRRPLGNEGGPQSLRPQEEKEKVEGGRCVEGQKRQKTGSSRLYSGFVLPPDVRKPGEGLSGEGSILEFRGPGTSQRGKGISGYKGVRPYDERRIEDRALGPRREVDIGRAAAAGDALQDFQKILAREKVPGPDVWTVNENGASPVDDDFSSRVSSRGRKTPRDSRLSTAALRCATCSLSLLIFVSCFCSGFCLATFDLTRAAGLRHQTSFT